MKIINFTFAVIAMGAWLLQGCGNGAEQSNDLKSVVDTIQISVDEKPTIHSDEIKNLIHSVPHPVEMVSLIIATGEEFSGTLVSTVENIDGHTTAIKRALNLGVLGADLGYLNLNEQQTLSLEYLNAIKWLADELMIGHFFDVATLRRLAENDHHLDSIILISTRGFEKMDNFLIEKNRENISLAIIIGGWAESMHFACELVKRHPDNSDLYERIGEQKEVLDEMLAISEIYTKDNLLVDYMKDLTELRKVYDNVELITTYGEPEYKEVDGDLVVIDNSVSKVKMTAKDLKEITAQVEKFRNKIVS